MPDGGSGFLLSMVRYTLLMQWRRLWREQGALVVWLSVDAKDDQIRFVMALLHAVRRVASSAAVDMLAKQFAAQPHQEMEALTVLLAEIAELGTETFLVLDNAEKLPDVTVRSRSHTCSTTHRPTCTW